MTEKMQNEDPNKMRNKSFWRWILLGIAAALTITWLLLTPEGLLGKADAIGYAVCHRIAIRSFQIGSRPMPACARCSGLFLGALLGLFFQAVQGKKGGMPPLWGMILFGFLALSWVLDGINSFTMLMPGLPSLYQTQNWTRLVTGTGMGLGIAAVLWPSFVQTMFANWEESPALGDWRLIAGLLVSAVVMDGLILLEIPWILYPLSLLSAAGVLILLMMVYSMVFVMVFKKENAYRQLRELMTPLLFGYIVALIQIGLIDLLRFLWTGTWAGFNL